MFLPLFAHAEGIGQLEIVWNAAIPEISLQQFGMDSIPGRKITTQEKDPATGQTAAWRGAVLSELIEKALERVAPEQKAQVDMVVVKTASGAEAVIPRSLIVKYPVMLGFQSNNPAAGAWIVIPWTSKPKIMSEYLPLETYFLSGVTRLELGSYSHRYSSLYLKRRTDPAAMKGEKIFVQTCVSCHNGGRTGTHLYAGKNLVALTDLAAEKRTQMLSTAGHPDVKGKPKLSEKDRKSLIHYLDAYRTENPQQSASAK